MVYIIALATESQTDLLPRGSSVRAGDITTKYVKGNNTAYLPFIVMRRCLLKWNRTMFIPEYHWSPGFKTYLYNILS